MKQSGVFILQYISSIFIALLCTVFLLAFPPGGYAVMAEFKYILFLAICGGYVALIIIIRIQTALIGIQPIGDIRDIGKNIRNVDLAVKLLLLFLFFVTVSALLSEYQGTFRGAFRQEGVLTIAIYVLMCIFLSKYFRPQRWMLFVLGGSTVLYCLLSFVQLTGLNPFLLYPQGFNYYGADIYYSGRFLGTIGNVGLGGGFLSIIVGVFAMSLIKFEFAKKWLLVIPFFMAVLLIFEMRVDAALLALAVGFLLMLPVAVSSAAALLRTLIVTAVMAAAFMLSQVLVFYDGGLGLATPHPVIALAVLLLIIITVFAAKYDVKISASWLRNCAVGFVVVVLCLSLFYVWSFGDRHSGMIFEASEIMHGQWSDEFGTWRVYIWRNVIEGIEAENLLFGTGPDTLGFWDTEPFIWHDPLMGTTHDVTIDTAHNEYLQILATGGLLSLLAYLGVLIYIAIQWFSRPDNALLAVSGAGVLFYCIQAFFGISMFISAPFFWTCLAVVIYSLNSEKKHLIGGFDK